ncbi:MAG: FHA domain-containing protein, partial [Myxococcota bacterium]
PPPPFIVLHAGTADEQAMRLETDVTIGRGRACTVRVKDSRASRQHCRLFERQGAWYIEDLGSANGTLVNGDFVAPEMPHPLHPGDQIVVGSVHIRFERDAHEAQYAS